MGKRKDDSAEIQHLLDEKAQVEQWLEKIRAAGNKTPESVRAKVESDYRQRLDAVLSRLEGFGDSLSTALAEEIKQRDRLAVEESERAGELAEAELRYAVGEYDDGQWEGVRRKLDKEVAEAQAKLEASEGEIARLEEVLGIIEGGGAPEPPKPAAKRETSAPKPKPEPEPEPDIDEPDIEVPAAADIAELPDEIEPPPLEVDVPVVPAVEAFEKDVEPTPLRVSQQTDAFDEMQFLRSVTEDEAQGPDAARASGVHRLSTQDLVSPVEEISPESGGTESLGGEDVVDTPQGEPAAEAIGAEGVEAVAEQKGRPTKGTPLNQKTVRCGECGALNLPSEWYCERCGAELAAL